MYVQVDFVIHFEKYTLKHVNLPIQMMLLALVLEIVLVE